MTDSVPAANRVSRRRALSGAFAAAAATLTCEVVAVPRARAATNQPIIASADNVCSGQTSLEDVGSGEPFSLYVTGNSLSGNEISAAIGGIAFNGGDGLYGESARHGVHGATTADQNGVFGESNGTGSGVYGQNDSTGYGVAGRANAGVGVFADSSSGTALLV